MAVAVIAACVVAPAFAQDVLQKPGPPKRPDNMILWGSYIAAGLLLGAVCVGSFKASKRTHQD